MSAPRPIKLKEIAERINAHLKRFEADPVINVNTREDRKGLSRFYHASAYQSGSYVGVNYITYQGSTSLSRARALAYLEALDSGYVGRHFEFERQLKDAPK